MLQKAKPMVVKKSVPSLSVQTKPALADAAPVFVPKKGMHPIPLVRGMRDILPADQMFWKAAALEAEKIADAYSYERIDTPLVEDTALFVRGIGKATDVVEKEW